MSGVDCYRVSVKKAKRQKRSEDSTPVAVAIAALCGIAALYCSEIIYDNIRDSGAPDMRALPAWRAHMASGCVGSLAFVTALFLLQSLAGRSKGSALRSAVPWFPLVALTGLATAVQIPIYLVVGVSAVYIPWAYLQTRLSR
jgi:uncharacterized membrane protein YuzA (DUF378 family)